MNVQWQVTGGRKIGSARLNSLGLGFERFKLEAHGGGEQVPNTTISGKEEFRSG
jgi:hypothetical protein